jgi:phosphoglycerate dehydrogenase-like enzyme
MPQGSGSAMRVVYPDGSPYMRSLLDPTQVAALPDFLMYDDAPASEDDLVERLKDAWGMVLGWARINERVLAACPSLKLISFTGVGVTNYVDLDAATRHGVAVTNTPHYGDDTVAEYTLALLLGLARHITILERNLREGRWDQEPAGIELRGKTLGIMGLGAIGSRVARFGTAMGMRVVAWTLHPSPERAAANGVSFVPRDELAAVSDVISIHLALTSSTRHLVDGPFLSRMKKGALLINTGRGEIVDTAALIAALQGGYLGGAALDVFEDEPLPPSHPLLRLENVLLTPHAGFNSREAARQQLYIAVDNVVTFLQGRPQNVVNPRVLSSHITRDGST